MITLSFDNEIQNWLNAHRNEIVEQLISLVRIPSVRGEALPDAPFGKECRDALLATEQLFQQYGFTTRTEAERGYTIACRQGNERIIDLMAHADVVPVQAEDWIYTAPFDPIVKNGVLIGRGCGDNKAGIIASLCAMRMIDELHLPVQSTLRAFIGANEETGMADVQAYVANEPFPDLALVADGYFPCSLGERSKLGLWVECNTPFTAIRDFSGGVSSTVIMGAAQVLLPDTEPLRTELQQMIDGDERFSLQSEATGLMLQSIGKPAHAATHPQEGINAALQAAQLLSRCKVLPESDRRILQTVHDALIDIYGTGLSIDHDDTRFGKLTVACGLAEMQNGHLRLNLDLRYGTELEPSVLKEQLRSVWERMGWSAEIITDRIGCIVEDDHPVPPIICDVYRQITSENKPAYYLAGATHAHYIKNGISIGFCVEPKEPKIPLPQGHGAAHQSDEALDIDGFMAAIRILTHTIMQSDPLL